MVGQHLIYTNNDSKNPFSACVASDVYLPKSWTDDPNRCKRAHIPEDALFRTKWEIAADQVDECIADGVRFAWITCDEEYTSVPEFIYRMDRSGQRLIGEVRSNFRCWTKRPACRSFQGPHASKQVDNVCRFSPVFTSQKWSCLHIKETTRGECVWDVKAARVHLVTKDVDGRSCPTDRQYWLIVARNPETEEIKYFVCNASENTSLEEMLRVAFARWHVEKWFERAKQQCGFGSFEVRTYQSLIRHWLCSRIAMYILATETTQLRKKIRRSHSSKFPEHSARSCSGRLKAIQFSSNYWQPSTNTTNIEIEYLMKVDDVGRKSAEPPRVLPSAVILVTWANRPC